MEFKNNELESIESELLDVSFKLNLFLNAGLIVSKSMEELCASLEPKNSPLGRIFTYAMTVSKDRNIPFENQLFICAKEIRSKSLMRFASLIIDSKSKGSELADKLERERTQKERDRLSLARAKAKEAETKLCFPLFLLLGALILICIAPAMMALS